LVLAVSALTFRFVERPGRTYFNALAARRREPAARVAPAE
jgi:peptidoglycan/LPS O-acetylase OafA/YrhL